MGKEAAAARFRELTDWAVAVRTGDIPQVALTRATQILADDLCAIVAARSEPEVERFHQHILGEPRPAEATVFRGGRPRTDRCSAAVANALAGDWLELDEGYRKTPCHAGLYVLPALLAEAEFRDAPVADVLRSLVLSYEVVTRVARAWTPSNLAHQGHARYGAIGAAAAVALLRGKTGPELHDALSGATTLVHAGPRSHLAAGALIRNAWPALGAWSGMMSVTWAECGITGIADSLYDVLTTVLGGTAHPTLLTEGLGESWAVLDGYTKIYACCQQTHAAVEATLALRSTLLRTATLETVEAITIETHPFALALNNPCPSTTLAGKFSLPHVVAVTLVTGAADADAFAARMLAEPRVARLRERVALESYRPERPPPNDRPARITVTLSDGQRLSQECLSARGGPDRPFPPSILDDKIASMMVPTYPRFADAFVALARLDPHVLRQGWAGFVEAFTG
jgi:2-methylcitrate dehydratase PrpD